MSDQLANPSGRMSFLTLEPRTLFDGSAVFDAVLTLDGDDGADAITSESAEVSTQLEQAVQSAVNAVESKILSANREDVFANFGGGVGAQTDKWNDAVDQLQADMAAGSVSVGIALVSDVDMGGESALFVAEGLQGDATIYLDKAWVENASSDELDSAITEKLNEFIESRLAAQTREVYFIDGSLKDVQVLIDSVPEGAEIYIVDADVDGYKFMAETLLGQTDVDAIHVLGHGSVGAAELGSVTLSEANLAEYADELGIIGAALSESGDILLYGCNVAGADQGEAFINQIASITNADIAASDDVTGQSGDWDLEVSSGLVKAEALSVADYTGDFATYDARSAQVGNEVFLGGKYIEIGIHYTGSYGTSQSAPSEFFGTSSNSKLGLSNDADGYDLGTDLRIDYFLPGSPAEGFAVGVNGVSYENYGLNGSHDIPGVTVTDTSNVGSGELSATVEFTIDGLHVVKTISFGENDTYFKTEVVMTNTTGTAMNDVRYIRGFDPDNTVYTVVVIQQLTLYKKQLPTMV